MPRTPIYDLLRKKAWGEGLAPVLTSQLSQGDSASLLDWAGAEHSCNPFPGWGGSPSVLEGGGVRP